MINQFAVRFFFLFIIFLCTANTARAQQDSLQIYRFYNLPENKTGYELDFEKSLPVTDKVYEIMDSIQKIGYYTLTLDSIRHNNIYYQKGLMYKKIWVKKNAEVDTDLEWYPTNNLDSIVNAIHTNYNNIGYPFSKVTIVPVDIRNHEARVELKVEPGQKRHINDLEIVGYEKISAGYLKNALKIKKGTVYNESELSKISYQISLNPYIRETKKPQTLFNEDKTTIYLYLEKVNSNIFDGIIGFGNDDNGDFRVNGNVKLQLNNVFNKMEQVHLNWISTPNANSSLDLFVKLPYLFRTPVGLDSQLNVLRTDSTFVTTSIHERLYYQLNQQSSIGVNYRYENSNFVLDEYPELAVFYDDYIKTGFGLSYEFTERIPNPLLEGKTYFSIVGNSLKRRENNYITDSLQENLTTRQYEIGIKAMRIFTLGKMHLLKGSIEAFGLFSEDDIFADNELYRIGGFGSIRGFNEMSIITNLYSLAVAEYRFMPNDGFYISLFADYAYVENKITSTFENLIGAGTGLSFLTKIGIFNLSYAVGKYSDTPFDFRNSKIHFGILSKF